MYCDMHQTVNSLPDYKQGNEERRQSYTGRWYPNPSISTCPWHTPSSFPQSIFFQLPTWSFLNIKASEFDVQYSYI